MKFKWPWQKKEQPQEPAVNNPSIHFELVDGMHLNIKCEWPPDCDLTPFGHILSWINSGNLIDPQLAAIIIYGKKINQSEKAMGLCMQLEQSGVKHKGSPQDSKKPVIPPSKVIPNQIKFHQH